MNIRLIVLLLITITSPTWAVTELPKLLQLNKPVYDLSSSEEDLVFRVIVPRGAESLRIITSGGRGDCDIYSRFGAYPADGKFDGFSTGLTNREIIEHLNPTPGVWFVSLHGAPSLDDVPSFRGVKLVAKVVLSPAASAAPLLTPGPGTFSGTVKVRLRSAVARARIFYTTDGSIPTANSARYRTPLRLSSTTTLKSVAYLNGQPGPVVEAVYKQEDPNTVNTLQSGIAATHLCGNSKSFFVYKLNVPDMPVPGARLRVESAGGSGNTALYLRRGAPPTPKQFHRRSNRVRNVATIEIPDAQPGDWYIGVRGLSDFSGITVVADLTFPIPDLIVWKDSLTPYVTTEVFDPLDCAVIEGHAVAGKRRLLRFNTESRNIGGADLVIGSPIGQPHFEYHECHDHYHFLGFAQYRLLNMQNEIAAVGRKVSFCLEDIYRWNDSAPVESKFTCDYQGIQAGWSDIYNSGLEGQWVDITGVPAGEYLLEVTMNPEHFLLESDYTNNSTTIQVTIPPSDF